MPPGCKAWNKNSPPNKLKIMQKILFIDRDGTLIAEPADDFQVDSLEKFRFIPGVITALKKLVTRADYRLVMVTNQDGLGTENFPLEKFTPLQNLLVNTLQGEGIVFDAIHIDPSLPSDNSPNRKPGTGMLSSYLNGQYNLADSYVIGDRFTDVELAENIGSRAILFQDKHTGRRQSEALSFVSNEWEHIVNFLMEEQRQSRVKRKTKETDIDLYLNLNRFENPEISTGIGFFNHMLEQIGYHGQVTLRVNCTGDLEVDEHHTIEDTALALGEAFANALKNKKGLNRYGFTLPMDEAIASTSIDFGGRPYLKWNVANRRDTIGGIDATLFEHFFRSFSQKAECTLHISAEGENDHHIIEAVFKSFARSVKMAVQQNPENELPSSKGQI